MKAYTVLYVDDEPEQRAFVEAILQSAVGVITATAAVQAHAADCPACPQCVVGPGWQR